MTYDRTSWADTTVGTTLRGRYRLDRLLETGGMGAVFEGVDLELGRPVAIKVLLPERSAPTDRARMQREAKRAVQVRGPGVVEVYDFGVDGEVAFLVMERLHGETLASLLRRESMLRSREAVDIVVEVLDTLRRVHEHGVIHRDLKPENLFLAQGPSGRHVKVLDFGLARLVVRGGGETVTDPSSTPGTPRFMAPEQIAGEPNVDVRADLYAMGAVLYTMLAGKRPYASSPRDEAMALAMTGQAPIAIERLNPSVHPPLAAIAERALSFEREDRFESAGEMLLALRRCVALAEAEGVDLWARPSTHSLTTTAAERPTRRASPEPERVRRSRGRAFALAVLSVLALSGVGWVAYEGSSARSDPASEASSTETAALGGPSEARAASHSDVPTEPDTETVTSSSTATRSETSEASGATPSQASAPENAPFESAPSETPNGPSTRGVASSRSRPRASETTTDEAVTTSRSGVELRAEDF